ncbi:hypothetical protein MFIFM68171_07257 [Madurella fahalii]|uniref:Uncharacterized protein n=1 Tax=Madurella fahalii TaxID=1157608 RepID=A0ABQ0GH01_9PEZI
MAAGRANNGSAWSSVRTNNRCQYAGEDVLECLDKNDNWFRYFPIADYDKTEVYNPKEIISDSLPNVGDMLNRFQVVSEYGDWNEFMLVSDLVDATSLPAFSSEEAVTSMEKIVETADEIVQAQREEFILSFITGLLFWIPFVGEAVGAAGMTTARTLLRLIGGVGEAGMAIHDVIGNPDNAFMAVFGYLLGAGVGRAGFKSAAESRRGMSADEFNSLANVKTRLMEYDDVRSLSCPL